MARRLVELDAAERRREIATAAGSLVVTWSILLGVYFLLGLAGHAAWTAAGVLVVGGLLFGASLTRQVRKVVAAEIPELRAAQALGTSVMLFFVLFASTYLALSADSFSRRLDHVSALYFVITVFSTVGFGDITPETDLARIVVAVQMLLDLIVIGVIVRVFVTAARSGLAARERAAEGPAAGNDPPNARPR